uniref:G_PROTEIN_RECEP_F1_2 domain-containing protein n=1 Tax=Rhabditophanes sp. KR3021 TaxID=114890 RepID=A0AC35TLN5_9BILA
MQRTEIQIVLPPPNHEDLHVLIMAVCYMILFLVGTGGNVAILTTIYHVVRSQKTALDNTLIYVIVLSCVDFGVCLSLPFTIIDQILGFWMFGNVLCKLHAVLENFGKILSSLILTAMSFDRFAGVCMPQRKNLRSTRFAIYMLVGLTVYALAALLPLLLSFSARELVLFEKETAPYKITRMKIEKCTMKNISSFSFTAFTIYQCVLCFIVPLVLISFFYYKLLSRLRQHSRNFKGTHIPLARISLYTLAIACFYFISWMPFWASIALSVYLEYAEDTNKESNIPHFFVYCMYFVHALPYFNSSMNWFLYGALNSQLQLRARNGGNLRSELTNNASYNAGNNMSVVKIACTHSTYETGNNTSVNKNSYKLSAPLSSSSIKEIQPLKEKSSAATESSLMVAHGNTIIVTSICDADKPQTKPDSDDGTCSINSKVTDAQSLKSKENLIAIGYDCESDGTFL